MVPPQVAATVQPDLYKSNAMRRTLSVLAAITRCFYPCPDVIAGTIATAPIPTVRTILTMILVPALIKVTDTIVADGPATAAQRVPHGWL